jgi:hypothetical protein
MAYTTFTVPTNKMQIGCQISGTVVNPDSAGNETVTTGVTKNIMTIVLPPGMWIHYFSGYFFTDYNYVNGNYPPQIQQSIGNDVKISISDVSNTYNYFCGEQFNVNTTYPALSHISRPIANLTSGNKTYYIVMYTNYTTVIGYMQYTATRIA